ncbi:hypothetical protein NQ317_008723, partial [Molorchus minor]
MSEYYENLRAANQKEGSTRYSGSGSRPVDIASQNQPNIKLPQIIFPKFSGAYENCLEFRDTFDSLINSNSVITDIQRYHYLRAALEDGAWETLLQRYNNTNVLVHNHIKSIFDLPNLTQESAADLRKMLDSVSKHLRSLQSLEQPVEHWGTLLVYILSNKLDKTTAREWEKMKGNLDPYPQQSETEDDKKSATIQNPAAILKLGEGERTKTLGLYWFCASDDLMYTITNSLISTSIAKRSVLSDYTSFSGTNHFLSDLDTCWHRFRQQLPVLNTLQVSRPVLISNPITIEIHGFSDASSKAYGACIHRHTLYIRSVSLFGEIVVRLLCAKIRVAPLKSLTIPTLKLCGTLLLRQLVNKVKNSLSFDEIFLWCDSSVCLSWIQTQPNRLQVFIQNRVAQIQELTQSRQWHYVHTKENPATFSWSLSSRPYNKYTLVVGASV